MMSVFLGTPMGNRRERSERNSGASEFTHIAKRQPRFLGFVQHSCAHKVCYSPWDMKNERCKMKNEKTLKMSVFFGTPMGIVENEVNVIAERVSSLAE